MEVEIFFANLLIWQLLEEVRYPGISIFLANELLVNYWKLNGNILYEIFHIGLPSHEIEGILSQLNLEVLIFKEWMLLLEGDVDVFLGAAEQSDDSLTKLVGVLPGVDKVESVMSW